MELVDTHCHIHAADYPLPIAEVDAHSHEAGVDFLLCVGTDAADSERALAFVADLPHSWAAVGQHPHEAKYGMEPLEKIRALVEADSQDQTFRLPNAGTWLRAPQPIATSARPETPRLPGERSELFANEEISGRQSGDSAARKGTDNEAGIANISVLSDAFSPSSAHVPAVFDTVEGREGDERRQRSKIVAIGECGLDYFYGHSSKKDQEKALRYQIELALEFGLPLTFHVREAFDDFWPIFDSYQGVRGVLHSFTDDSTNLSKAITRGLYIGVNGIVTFTKNPDQLEVAQQIPLNRLVLETDAPFLTPAPLRGKVNEPAHVLLVARFLSDLRQISLQEVAQITTTNARQLLFSNQNYKISSK